jgi:2-oxo-4-hydroxy-4-carboxy--5-ureidoimidazoline (OHCU) decarboxylase
LRELASLNDEYERKFGFRFVVFLGGRPRTAIVPVLRERLRRTRDDELATGIAEFLAITLDRLTRIAP